MSPWVAVPAGAAALAAVALAVALSVRASRRRPQAARSVEPAEARLLVLGIENDRDGALGARLVDALARRLGGVAAVAQDAASPVKPGRSHEETVRRARAAADKARAGLVIWGTVHKDVARLRFLAHDAAGAEAYALAADLRPPFDSALAALAAAVGAQSSALAAMRAPLAAAVTEASAALAATPGLDEAQVARVRAALARACLALHALEGSPAYVRAALEATAAEDPRRVAEPLEWAEVQGMRAQALARRHALQAEPSLDELGERVAACRAALDVWTERGALDRTATAEAALGQALIALADQDGDLRGVEEAERLAEAAQARLLGAREQGDTLVAMAALLGSARLRLGEREPRPSRLESAERELRRALVLAEARGDEARAISIKAELARALARLGERDRGSERLRAAAVVYRVCLAEDGGRDELALARLRAALGRTLVHVGERDRDAAAVDEAVAALRMASNSLAACGAEAATADARRALARAERLYSELRAAKSA